MKNNKRNELHPVVIIGAGPTGTALAIDLALRNTPSILVERYVQPQHIPKGQNLTQRTGEHLHFWGVTEEIRKATLIPPDYGNEGLVAYGSLLSGYHYDWFKRGAVGEFYAASNERLPQYETERILRSRAEQFDCITTLYGWSFVDCQQSNDHVSVKLEQTDDGKQQVLNASYLIGCDGARSPVRKAAAISQSTDDAKRRMALLIFHSPQLHDILDTRFPGKTIFNALDPDCEGYWKFFGRVDLEANWFFHAPVPIDASHEDYDFGQLLHAAVGAEFKFKLNYAGFWDLRFTHATNYRSRRVLIAGDAAHSHPPYGGYGLNVGFEDARNLAWKLAANYHGWGTDTLIDSYSAERHPVFASTRDDFILQMIKTDAAFVGQYSPHKNQSEFEQAWYRRADEGQREVVAYVPHYLGSPIIARSTIQLTGTDSVVVDDTTNSFMRSGATGTHTHIPIAGTHLSPGYFDNKQKLFDRLSQDFTLLIPPGGELVADQFNQAATTLGIPLLCIDVVANSRHVISESDSSAALANEQQTNAKREGTNDNEFHTDACVLVRPDHFIAWVEHRPSRQSLLNSDEAHQILAHCVARTL